VLTERNTGKDGDWRFLRQIPSVEMGWPSE
jgi:hypothetical protein